MCDDKCCDPSKNPRTVTNDARAAAAHLQKFAKINYGVWSGVQQTLTTPVNTQPVDTAANNFREAQKVVCTPANNQQPATLLLSSHHPH